MIIRVSNILDPDQSQHIVDPDLGPNSLQRFSADNKSNRLQGKSYEDSSVRVLDSRSRGCWLESQQRHCSVLEQDTSSSV